MTSLSQLVEQTAALKKKMQEDGKEAMKAAFAEFFEKHPEAKAIVWTQYTPYFNDGDACTFSVHEFELKVDPENLAEDVRALMSDDEEDGQDDYGYGEDCAVNAIERIENTAHNQKYYAESRKLRELTATERSLVDDFNELSDGCHKIPDVLETVLGDHIQVIATRKGFQVDEYSHD